MEQLDERDLLWQLELFGKVVSLEARGFPPESGNTTPCRMTGVNLGYNPV